MSTTCNELEGSSSGRRFIYTVMVWYILQSPVWAV